MSPIHIERQEAGGQTTLRIIGEVDLTTAPELARPVLTAQQPGTQLTLDLSAVEFLDSSGLQIIVDADIRAREQGSLLKLIAGTGEVARVLELTRVTDRLRVTTVE